MHIHCTSTLKFKLNNQYGCFVYLIKRVRLCVVNVSLFTNIYHFWRRKYGVVSDRAMKCKLCRNIDKLSLNTRIYLCFSSMMKSIWIVWRNMYPLLTSFNCCYTTLTFAVCMVWFRVVYSWIVLLRIVDHCFNKHYCNAYSINIWTVTKYKCVICQRCLRCLVLQKSWTIRCY
jgi:hypothetical protein